MCPVCGIQIPDDKKSWLDFRKKAMAQWKQETTENCVGPGDPPIKNIEVEVWFENWVGSGGADHSYHQWMEKRTA